MSWQKPTLDEISDVLRRNAPHLAGEPVAFLAEGWSAWAFRAGDYVLRVPKGPEMLPDLLRDRALLPTLAPVVPLPVPVPDIYIENGPNGAPVLGHPMLPGVLLTEAKVPLSPGFGRMLGAFLRALHSFPVARALDLGVPLDNGETLRRDRMQQYETVIRRVFPLVSCEARTTIEQVYERNLNDPANFQYEPRLVHRDMDSNLLVHPETGDPAGVIDFGDAIVGSIAFDLWLPVYGFEKFGIPHQTAACLEAAGVSQADLTRLQPELEFIDFRWCLLDILHGLDTDDPDYIEDGIRDLNSRVAAGTVCT